LNESPVLTPKFRGISVEFLGYPTRGSLSYQKITIPTKSSCQKLPGGYWVTVTGEKHGDGARKRPCVFDDVSTVLFAGIAKKTHAFCNSFLWKCKCDDLNSL